MRLVFKLAIPFYLFLAIASTTVGYYYFCLGMVCFLLLFEIVIFPQIEWNKKQKEKKGVNK